MSDLYTTICGIFVISVGILCFIGLMILEAITNAKKRDYVKKLNEHDSAVIHDYLNHTRLCFGDLKRKEVNNENI